MFGFYPILEVSAGLISHHQVGLWYTNKSRSGDDSLYKQMGVKFKFFSWVRRAELVRKWS
jgi:hypothetical protein